MTRENFSKNPLIMMDNAPYHNTLGEETFPWKSHSVKRLLKWLTNNKFPWIQDMLKLQFFDLCSRFAAKQEPLIVEITNKADYSVLRAPPLPS